MEGITHFLTSILLAISIFLIRPFESLEVWHLVLGVAWGTLIDLDHFLASRIRHGDWHHLRNVISKPLKVFTDYRESKENPSDSYFGSIKQVYITHFITSGAVSGIFYLFNKTAGIVTGIFLSLHIFLDFIGLLNLYRKGEID